MLTADAAIDPAALTAAERDALVAQLFPVHARIFAGTDVETFRAYVVDSPAARTRIQLFRGFHGRIVGYVATHVFEVDAAEGPVAVLRSEAGFLREARGRTAAGWLLFREAIGMVARYPNRRCCFMACPIHPASYYALARTSAHVYPRPDAATPADVQAVMDAMDGAFALVQPEGAGAHVRDVGWVTRETRAETASWAAKDSDLVQWYRQQNPTFGKGTGLRVVAPLSVTTAWAAGKRFLARIAGRKLAAAAAWLQQPVLLPLPARAR